MKYRAIKESSWSGTFYAVLECSACGRRLVNFDDKRHPSYCPYCGRKLDHLPFRLSSNEVVAALNAYVEKGGLK